MKFNNNIKEVRKIENYEGGETFVISPELELYSAVVTSSLDNKFYESDDKRLDRIAKLVAKVDPMFVAQLAIYARTQMYLRSMPMFLLVELAKVHNGDDLLSRAVEKTVLRADEITELLSCYQLRNASKGDTKKLAKLSKQIQIGLQRAFNNVDEYQFAKYNRSDAEVKLRDALFLVHPKAKDEKQQIIFNKIADKNLTTPYTWETELSALGQTGFESDEQRNDAFRMKWEELIDSGKLGYMALLRNLRNMLESNVDCAHIEKVCRNIADPNAIINSKQFPFRYLSAYRELEDTVSTSTSLVLSALEDAVSISAQNIKGFGHDTKVLLACDVSGSMQRSVSPRSKVESYDIGLMLSMLLKNNCSQVISGMFGSIWKVVNLPSDEILTNVMELHRREGEVGYSTNGHLVINWLIKNNVVMDKVMMFTDCQMWDSCGNKETVRKSWEKYKKIAPNAKLYLFDLAGYGSVPLDVVEPDVFLIAGWSDRVFDILDALENGNSVIDEIRKIEV